MSWLHRRSVRGYVTLNTLVFAAELPKIERAIALLAEAAVDAVLVQDLGLVRLIRAMCPDLVIHASTQMTLSSAESIRVVERMGVQRVVLARELSIHEISSIHQQTGVELEAFVHGALCVAYSGQCLTSESLGGRSANRGQCAQACRLPYELVCDGQDVELGAVKYLLSPQDLAAIELVPELVAAGVSCLKIEGRLKSPEYVANITRHYRRALDAACQQRPLKLGRQDIREMELSFSRGFSPGWLHGCDHKMLVPGLTSAKRGVLIGEVVEVRGRQVVARLHDSIQVGDGVVFAGDRERGEEQGGRVFGASDKGGTTWLRFQRGHLDLTQLAPGQEIWKTDDPRLTARLRKTFVGPDPIRRVPLDLQVRAAVGKPIEVLGHAENGARCSVSSEALLEVARKHPLSEMTLREKLGRLGGTVYELRHLDFHIDGSPMVPHSVLGSMRREIVEQLNATARHSPHPVRFGTLERLLVEGVTRSQDEAVQLRVLCRTLPQLRHTLGCGMLSVLVDFQDVREYRLAVEMADEHGAEIFLATPRIQKPNEAGLFKAMSRHGAAGFLVRNLAGLAFCRDAAIPCVADFSLNAANQLAVLCLLEMDVERITVSYDLNRDQLLDLVSEVRGAPLEVVIHQHMPMFHMEHCVFCAVLSPGTNKHNCGRPCDDHRVELRDRVGMQHTLLADVGCRNTLYNAVPQSAAEVVPSLLENGLRHFRIELLNEDGPAVVKLIELYRQLLDGTIRGQDVWQQLNAANRVGVTRGTLEERRNPLTIL